MKWSVYLLTLLYISLIFSNCGLVDIDESPPLLEWGDKGSPIQADSVCGELSPHAIRLMGGDTLALDLVLTDDVGLGQLKIDIHDNFDCHGHSNKTQDWYVQDILDLPGTYETLFMEYPVPPQPTAGYYHLTIRLIDDNGNEGAPSNIDLVVLNRADLKAPLIKVALPSSKELMVSKGEEVPLSYVLVDNHTLDPPNSRFVLQYRDFSSGNVFTVDQLDLLEPDSTARIEITFRVPSTWKHGYTYGLEAYGFDWVNNRSNLAERVMVVAE
ncbi:MAG: DUF4625 domain-containing protein [Bacteroidetes bacterium]|jgi:hypothetical protein|nr:DUF4625 domain-containing protein [Bacteroidota bacterium]